MDLKTLRKRSRMTQEKLAEAVGVSRITLSRWEAGTREPSASEIKKLCEILLTSALLSLKR